MESAIFIGVGIALFAVIAVFTATELIKLWLSDKYAKLEASMMHLALFFIGTVVAGFAVYAGWVISYPIMWTNGHPRRYPPQTESWLFLGGLFLLLAATAVCPIVAWWLKKRRIVQAKSDPDLIWAALYAEYGWEEARRLYEDYKRRQDPRNDE